MKEAFRFEDTQTYMITRDSFLNFEIGAKVKHFEKSARVIDIDGNMILISYLDSTVEKIHYSRLHVTELPNQTPAKSYKKWNTKDEHFLLNHIYLPNANIARLLDRSEDSILQKKHLLKPKQ